MMKEDKERFTSSKECGITERELQVFEEHNKWFDELEKLLKAAEIVERDLNPDDYFPVCELVGDEIFW